MSAATEKATNPAYPFGESIEETTDKIREFNEKLLDAAKQASKVSLDAYEKSVASFVDFETKAAEATKIDWVTTLTKAQTSYILETNKAFTTAAREVLK